MKRIPKRAKPLPEVELDALDDTVPAEKEEEKDGHVDKKTESDGETLAEVLPCLELPDADEIP